MDKPIAAVLIDSEVLQAPVWVSERDGWQSGDDIPVFSRAELRKLEGVTPARLRKVYEVKRVFGGGRVVK